MDLQKPLLGSTSGTSPPYTAMRWPEKYNFQRVRVEGGVLRRILGMEAFRLACIEA